MTFTLPHENKMIHLVFKRRVSSRFPTSYTLLGAAMDGPSKYTKEDKRALEALLGVLSRLEAVFSDTFTPVINTAW